MFLGVANFPWQAAGFVAENRLNVRNVQLCPQSYHLRILVQSV